MINNNPYLKEVFPLQMCREIIDIGFPGHSYSSSSSDPGVKNEQSHENCHQKPETNGPPHGQNWC